MAGGEILACSRRLSIHSRLQKPEGGASLECGCGDDHPSCASAEDLNLAEKELLTRKDVFQVLESLYRDHPGPVWRVESRKAMEMLQGPKTVKCLIYGEVSFIAFARILELSVPLAMSTRAAGAAGFIFYDLGCGAGRPVFMAPLLRPDCVKSCGIEIIPSMHKMNRELLNLYKAEVEPFLHHSRRNSQDIGFILGDFLQEDWSDADIVFANATCFDDLLFEQLERKANSTLREGAVVISVTRSFTTDTWELVQQLEMKMSWASAQVHVQRKRRDQNHKPLPELGQTPQAGSATSDQVPQPLY